LYSSKGPGRIIYKFNYEIKIKGGSIMRFKNKVASAAIVAILAVSLLIGLTYSAFTDRGSAAGAGRAAAGYIDIRITANDDDFLVDYASLLYPAEGSQDFTFRVDNLSPIGVLARVNLDDYDEDARLIVLNSQFFYHIDGDTMWAPNAQHERLKGIYIKTNEMLADFSAATDNPFTLPSREELRAFWIESFDEVNIAAQAAFLTTLPASATPPPWAWWIEVPMTAMYEDIIIVDFANDWDAGDASDDGVVFLGEDDGYLWFVFPANTSLDGITAALSLEDYAHNLLQYALLPTPGGSVWAIQDTPALFRGAGIPYDIMLAYEAAFDVIIP
jgi:hypothetical protein